MPPLPPPFDFDFLDAQGNLTQPWREFLLQQANTIGSDVAPSDGRYLITRANGSLPSAVNLGLLVTGYLRITVALGVAAVASTPTIPAADLAGPTINATVTGSSLTSVGTITTGLWNSNLRLKGPFIVATLPATPVQGDMAYVTDLLAPAFLAIAVGGGAVIGPVFYNGTNWISV